MSELQGPRIPGEERSGRRRPLGWIIGGLIGLLLLALLIPFACQAIGGGAADSQGGGSGAQEEKAIAQEADDGRGGGDAKDADDAENMGAGGTGENAQAEPAAGNDGSQVGKETASEADGAAGSAAEEDSETTPNDRADAGTGGDLPETGGMSPTVLLVVGSALLLMGSTGLSAVVRRRSASRG